MVYNMRLCGWAWNREDAGIMSVGIGDEIAVSSEAFYNTRLCGWTWDREDAGILGVGNSDGMAVSFVAVAGSSP